MNRRAGKRQGIATVELAVALPLLLILLFGVVDFGRLLLVDNEITNLSREAANLAWRGTSFQSTISAIYQASGDSDGDGTSNLEENGCIIMSRIERDQNDNPVIIEQLKLGQQPRATRVGTVGSAVVLPVPELPRMGQQLIVAEVFMNYVPVTPFGIYLGTGTPGSSMPRFMYDAAFFY